MMNLNLDTVKAKQYLVIAETAMCVKTNEMPRKEIELEILAQYKKKLLAFKPPPNLIGLTSEQLLRTKNILSLSHSSVSDTHDGESLWHKWGDIKRIVVGQITEAFVKQLARSGFSPDITLQNTRKAPFDSQEDRLQKSSKSKDGYKKKQYHVGIHWSGKYSCSMVWFPLGQRKYSPSSKFFRLFICCIVVLCFLCSI